MELPETEPQVDVYNDNVTTYEPESTQNDAMGDLVDPETMTLDDFLNEWVWRDDNTGFGKTPWFMKPIHQDQGIGRNWPKADLNANILDKMAVNEEQVISTFGIKFYERINRLASHSLMGNRDEEIWFTNDDGESVMVRSEVMNLIDAAERLWASSMPLKTMMTKYGTTNMATSAKDAHQIFVNNGDKRWTKVKNSVIEAALTAKNEVDGEIGNEQVEQAVNTVKSILGVPMLSKAIYKFVVNLFWTAIKTRFTGSERALLVKWLGAKSQETDLLVTADRYHIDNFFVEN